MAVRQQNAIGHWFTKANPIANATNQGNVGQVTGYTARKPSTICNPKSSGVNTQQAIPVANYPNDGASARAQSATWYASGEPIVIDKQRLRALQAEIDRAKATGKPYQAWENLKQKHCAGKIQLTYPDLVWLGYLLGFRYGWATIKAFELGLFTLKHPTITQKAVGSYQLEIRGQVRSPKMG